ncbi:MAG: GSCFA domain-containing protein [Bacteroidota bacterium]
MNEKKVNFDFPFKITHNDRFLMIGSCFTDNMHERFCEAGFGSRRAENGTVFHPKAISKYIFDLHDPAYDGRVIQREDLFFSLDFSSKTFALDKSELLNQLDDKRMDDLAYLKGSKYLFVTFGTAFGYEDSSGEIVANCHKLPSSNFNKRLYDVAEMTDDWVQLISFLQTAYPQLEFIFTVSPVRHSKDGLIENSRSKARLQFLCEELSKLSGCHYFPSYEIMMDVLVDRYYYEDDGIHPNKKAVDFMWEVLADSLFTDETRNIVTEGLKLRVREKHIPLHGVGREAKSFQLETEKLILDFQKTYPDFCWHYPK